MSQLSILEGEMREEFSVNKAMQIHSPGSDDPEIRTLERISAYLEGALISFAAGDTEDAVKGVEDAQRVADADLGGPDWWKEKGGVNGA